MLKYLAPASLRSTIPAVLATMLLLSLVCSLSLRHGHADQAIAESAGAVRPLGGGDAAPRFVVRDVSGEPYDFDPRRLERPVVIVTFRGGWCPYCNMHLSELRNVMPDILSLGVDVLFLSGDRPELLYASLEQGTQDDIAGLDYTILSDADAQAAIALGIAFRASARTIQRRHEKGEDIADSSMLRHGILPVPAVFVVGADGVIAYAFVEPDYKVRLPAEELLAAVQAAVQ
jgi:peroxiredoxin